MKNLHKLIFLISFLVSCSNNHEIKNESGNASGRSFNVLSIPNSYSVNFSADSLIKFLEEKRHVDLSSIKITKINKSKIMQSPDNDIALGMNLLFEPTPIEMGYPIYSYEDSLKKTRLKMIIVGDSYVNSLMNSCAVPACFSRIDFWSYNQVVYHNYMHASPTPVKDLGFAQEINKTNVIMVLATEANLSSIGWGFINEVYDNFYSYRFRNSNFGPNLFRPTVAINCEWRSCL